MFGSPIAHIMTHHGRTHNASVISNHTNIILESDNLPEINFTFLLPSLRVQERDNGCRGAIR